MIPTVPYAVGVDACIDPRADASIRPYNITAMQLANNNKPI